MTNESLKKGDNCIENMRFIGKNYNKMKPKCIGNEWVFIHDDIYFDPYVWFSLFVQYHSYAITSINDIEAKINYLNTGKFICVQQVELSHNACRGLGLSEKYNFSGFVNQFDALINIEISKVQIKLLQSQSITNESTIESNGISKTTNILIAIFTGAGAIWYLRDVTKSVLLDYYPIDKDKLANLNSHGVSILNIISLFIVALVLSLMLYILLVKRKKYIK